ncbi:MULTISPECIES: hypothetical protein [Halobacteriovorax]|uniref:Cobalt transporter n=1 Tax=Halobacteriovorax vibrionivorans TaxID=2152716 RepID=A0ABY0IH46_9BACT|nr:MULTISPECIES: hypothetical protein [Halobacteriovorax]AYF44036.1 hypothetical protein BALOs_1026 [Halobacteriovorax sp. BALOs_7]RZF21438.1 hypothetical protein DAY19_07060 [Halobacteriovorax vibrionivorans]TGD48711.1 hypothetical protein EP118_02535 [Halobacteriovorax sp. Y22]
MLRILLSLFTIAMIFVSFSHEAHEVMTELQVKVEKINSSHDITPANHCDGHDSNPDHCHIHCTGLHFVADIHQVHQLDVPVKIESQLLTSGDNFFKSPFLDPTIKPPSYS